MEQFRVRLNCVDHYQANPSHFDPQLFPSDGVHHKNSPKVPVIRVFGATETGQKVCAHIHGAFPYLFIEYAGELAPDAVAAYIQRLHASIDHALTVSFRKNVYDEAPRYVARITLVKGIPFYGYFVGYKYFLKIYMLNPRHMTRLSDLLRQASIMGKVFQPHESHLQYLLQWMCDYNLYGCGYINCERVKFRSPVPDYEEMNSPVHLWHSQTIPTRMISDDTKFPRESHCSLEVDICVQDILNKRDVQARPIHHDFTEMTNPLPPDMKLVPSLAGLWRDEERRRRIANPTVSFGGSSFPPEALLSMSAGSRTSQRSGWIHEEEYIGRISELIREERIRDGERFPLKQQGERAQTEAMARTAYDSIGDLWPENLCVQAVPQKSCSTGGGPKTDVKEEGVDVDEDRALNVYENDFQYDSDEDLTKELDILSQKAQEDQEGLRKGGSASTKSADGWPSPHQRYKDQHCTSPTARCNQSSSPDGLAELGIRDEDDFNHIEEDDFDIPQEFASDIDAARRAAKRSAAVLSPLHSKRRRKLADSGYGQAMDDKNKPNSKTRGEREKLNPSVQSLKTINHYTLSAKKVSITPEIADGRPPSSQVLRRVETRSQVISRGNGARGNQTLPFTVVKDPFDPHTIQSLSQRSDFSSQKSIKSSKDDIDLLDSSNATKTQISLSRMSNSTFSTPNEVKFLNIARNLDLAFGPSGSAVTLLYPQDPPTADYVLSTIESFGLPQVIYQDPYYSDERDVPDRPREYAGREFRLESDTAPFLPDFGPTATLELIGEKIRAKYDKSAEERRMQRRKWACKLRSWEIGKAPPSRKEVEQWLEQQEASLQGPEVGVDQSAHLLDLNVSQIEGPIQKNRHGFKYSQKQESTSVQHETQYMSIMSLEVHVNTRGKLAPNPEEDEISCVFWCLQSDEEHLESNGINEGTHVGIIALSEQSGLAHKISRQVAVKVEEESSELDLINKLIDIVRLYDPDILTGYEVHNASWGYLIERAGHKYEYDLCEELSRVKSQSKKGASKGMGSAWGLTHGETMVTGRHMLNIWRMVQSEMPLLQYTMENVVFHLLHRRIPHYSHRDLTAWYQSTKPRELAKCIDYYVSRVQLDLEILDRNELIPRTSEQARILGVDFFSVISRGSQFKVESFMFRLAKPENFVFPSPSRKQVGGQNALECLPLVMEPQSAFYTSPVLVLDFQSLYPSIVIAYNYCYSTFLGRIESWRGTNKMGFSDYKRQPGILEFLKDRINIAPNGMMYVKQEVRRSLLAKMLSEILETRVMVKSSMKQDKDDRVLQRLLNNRQLALKLLANVTYGYTSASFSGRMPCSEIADSIVQSGRETLEKAIALIHSDERWNAEVVYGDTDSIFVHLKGRSKEEAFRIGDEISKAVTDMNPRPIKLKFEKVYLPCVLLAKKRYVGFKYEHKDQKEPEFEAKGIETVRRDGTPAEQKIEEKALKILYKTADLSQVKEYFQRQCSKIMKGRVSVQDFCFAKEVRLGTYSERGPPPPGVLISTRKMMEDPRAEPQYGQRVPYVVITGPPGARLIDRCVAPETLLNNDHIELDAEYYISKNLIPPLERIFNLVGANVRMWYDEMPKIQRIRRVEGRNDILSVNGSKDSKKTLESYMKSSACIVCSEKLESENPLCEACLRDRETSMLALRTRLTAAEKKAADLQRICRSCAGLAFADEVTCDSLDCPVFYSRTRAMAELGSTRAVVGPVVKMLEAKEDWADW